MIKHNLIFTVVVSTLLTACVEPAPRYEAEFGNATRATLKAQIINPNAGNNPDPVAGVDGPAGRSALQNYNKSFTKPEPKANTLNIGVGDSKSSN